MSSLSSSRTPEEHHSPANSIQHRYVKPPTLYRIGQTHSFKLGRLSRAEEEVARLQCLVPAASTEKTRQDLKNLMAKILALRKESCVFDKDFYHNGQEIRELREKDTSLRGLYDALEAEQREARLELTDLRRRVTILRGREEGEGEEEAAVAEEEMNQ